MGASSFRLPRLAPSYVLSLVGILRDGARASPRETSR